MIKICPACQNRIEDMEAKFCFKCGYSFVEQKSREDLDRQEDMRAAEEARQREEAERQAEAARQAEAERRAEEQRYAEAERQRLEAERRAEAEREKAEARRQEEAERKRAEEEYRQAEEERKKLEQQRQAEYKRQQNDPTKDNPNVKECPKCHTRLGSNAKFCYKCQYQFEGAGGGAGGGKKNSNSAIPFIIMVACILIIGLGIVFFNKMKENRSGQTTSTAVAANDTVTTTESTVAATTAATTEKQTVAADVIGDPEATTTEATTEWKPQLDYVIEDGKFITDSEAIDLNDRIRALRQDYSLEIMAITIDDALMDKEACKAYLQECCSNYIGKEGFVFLINKATLYYSIGYTSGFEIDKNHISGFYEVVDQSLAAGKNEDAIYQGIKFIIENHQAALNPNFVDTRAGIHRYEIIVADRSWNQAKADAESKGGHLVTFETDEEFRHVVDLISKSGNSKVDQYWVGGTRSKDDTKYYWCYENGAFGNEVLNQDSKYASYWLAGEPTFRDDSVNADEQYMDILNMGSDGWKWNDAPDDLIMYVSYFSGKIGYIVEYEN